MKAGKNDFDISSCDAAFDAVLYGRELPSDSLFQLSACFMAGYRPERLLLLLNHTDVGVVSDGAFVLSELGAGARPFLEQAERLLSHPDSQVRRYAIDTITSCASPEDGSCVARMLELLCDPSELVQNGVINFLVRKDFATLTAAEPHLQNSKNSNSHKMGLKMLSLSAKIPDDKLSQLLGSTDAVLVGYGKAIKKRQSKR